MNTAAGISIPYINKVRSNHMNKDVSDRCHSAPPLVFLTGPALRSKVLLLATVIGAAYVMAQTPLAGPEYVTEENWSILVKKVFNGNWAEFDTTTVSMG